MYDSQAEPVSGTLARGLRSSILGINMCVQPRSVFGKIGPARYTTGSGMLKQPPKHKLPIDFIEDITFHILMVGARMARHN